jgi:hypothetical protein
MDNTSRSSRIRCFVVILALALFQSQVDAQSVSPAPFLQWFESSYDTIEDRMADVHAAGYGAMWLPPPGRADSGDQSVGYDVYDRFDLGYAKRSTAYGTETGLRTVADSLHRAGAQLHIDAIINHNGFSDLNTPGFIESGGYPGFLLQDPDGGTDPFGVAGTDGDFHSPFAGGDIDFRLSGLIDIDHDKDFRYIRHPVPGVQVEPGVHGGNLPAGTTPAFFRLANVPTEANRRFYPDRDADPIFLFDPVTGQQGIEVYPFNTGDPMAGDPVGENSTEYVGRYLRWMVQDIGVDGFRLDAAKHVEGFVLGELDKAVYRANPRPLLDGSTNHVFMYSEVFDTNRDLLQANVVKNIDPNDPGKIGGNRDALDFAQAQAFRDNLTLNGFQNDWRNVVNAGMDVYDDGLHNGSQGVMFVGSHDEGGAALSNVAHAYMLMHPGNAVVYLNGKEFGEERDFPKDGRGDALGGVYGDTITRLVEIRNSHGRGNYLERYLGKEEFAYEREGSSLVLLSNRTDSGFDDRRLDVNVPFGTYLVELTGNAKAWNDEIGNDDIPEVLQATNDSFEGQSYVNARFLRNGDGDRGYLIYGLQTPQSELGIELSDVASVLEGGTPEANDFSNGITRLEDLHVVTADSLDITLRTQAVFLPGDIRDRDADGSNALLKINGGVDVNGNGVVDVTSPDSVAYGFEDFTTFKVNGYDAADGNGEYRQTIDTSQLAEGTHFITARAFRNRDDGGPAVFSDFTKAIYVDRLKPVSEIASFEPFDPNNDANRDIIVRSVDKTAEAVHVFHNLPASFSDEQIMSFVGDNNDSGQIDRDQFAFGVFGTPHGNNVATVVTIEQTGNFNIQRFSGLFAETSVGAGLGDINFDGSFTITDVANVDGAFEQILYSQNSQFNAAADINGDGFIDTFDLLALESVYTDAGADAMTLDLLRTVRNRRVDYDFSGGAASQNDLAILESQFGSTEWRFDLDANGIVDQADSDFFTANFLVPSLQGDFNGDGVVDIDDIDFYSGKIGLTSADPGFDAILDLDDDGTIDLQDQQAHIRNFVQTTTGLAGTLPGDMNLDGNVNVLGDGFLLVSRLNGNAPFSYGTGDLNSDQQVNVLGDAFILVSNLGQSVNGSASNASTASVPEPSGLLMLGLGATATLIRRTRSR